MLRRINFYSVCFAFGLSVVLILAGSRYTDNTNYHPAASRSYAQESEEWSQSQLVPTNADDGSPNIDKILEKARLNIKVALENYNYTYSGSKKLEDLLLEYGGKPLRNIIFSTWRSGTTFLGEILNAMPGNFYHYEPLLNYGIIQIRGLPHSEKAISIIKKMLNCNFDNMEDYFEYGKTHLHQFSHNTRLWDHCKYKKELCYDADFTSKFCRLFPFQSMKVVRIRLHLIEEILSNDQLNMKAVLLIRDPRGVMQSRQHRNFCQPAPDCWQPELLCADMISDYVAATRLLTMYSERLMVLRYEELALNPNNTAKELLKFLRLSMVPPIQEFLHTHTNNVVAGVSSTFRVSRDVPFRWKNTLDFDYVDNIQVACKEAMELWGYRVAHNASHMTDKGFDPLMPYVIKL